MSNTIKNLEIAIRCIKEGWPLHEEVFSEFWDKKEDFLELAMAGGYVNDWFWAKYPKWYSSWKWDEEFVTKIFNAQTIRWHGTDEMVEITWLMYSLPDSITSSKYYRYLCSVQPRLFEKITGPGRDAHNKLQYLSKQDSDLKFRELFEEHVDLFISDLEATCSLIEFFEIAPSPVVNDRNLCLDIARHKPKLTYMFPRWLDDIDFAIELLSLDPAFQRSWFSYGIQKIIKDQDPRTSLMKFKLESLLPSKPIFQERKAHKI